MLVARPHVSHYLGASVWFLNGHGRRASAAPAPACEPAAPAREPSLARGSAALTGELGCLAPVAALALLAASAAWAAVAPLCAARWWSCCAEKARVCEPLCHARLRAGAPRARQALPWPPRAREPQPRRVRSSKRPGPAPQLRARTPSAPGSRSWQGHKHTYIYIYMYAYMYT